MTAEMIEWTLLLLEWMKASLLEEWPEAKLRGSAPEMDEEGYSIRIRDNGEEYWMVLHPDVMMAVPVSEATDLLVREDWIGHIKKTGCLHLGVSINGRRIPELHPCPYAS